LSVGPAGSALNSFATGKFGGVMGSAGPERATTDVTKETTADHRRGDVIL
jgi:hypothetical protein